MEPSVAKDEIQCLIVATINSKDPAAIGSNLTLMANNSARDEKYRRNLLSVMEDNVEEIEDLLEKQPRIFPDYLALLFSASSAATSGKGGRGGRRGGIAAYEVLQLSGGESSGGGRCIEALSRVVCNGCLDHSIRAACLKCMSELGVPVTYLRNRREVVGGESGDMEITALSKLYTANLNELVKTACESSFVLDVGQAASNLIKKFGRTDEDVELGLNIMEHLMRCDEHG